MRRLLPLITAPLLAAAPAQAGPRDDVQAWSTLAASGSLGGDWLAQGDVVLRFGAGGDRRLYQRTIRGALGRKLGKKASAYAGYAHVIGFVEGGPNRREHRPFQQLNLDLGKPLGGALSARTRLEERWMEGGGDMGLRLRQQLRYTRPVEDELSLFVSAEGFAALNDTDWGAVAGFERLRSAAGLRHPLAKKLSGEIGYLNQYTARRNARDTMDHALTLSVSLSF